MLTVVVSGIWSVVLPLVPNVAVPVPLFVIAKFMLVDGVTVMWALEVVPPGIGLGSKESIVTVGVTVPGPEGLMLAWGQLSGMLSLTQKLPWKTITFGMKSSMLT